jgi:hypothetical protein
MPIDDTYITKTFESNPYVVISQQTDINAVINRASGYLLEEFEKFTEHGSGWKLDHNNHFQIIIDKYDPLRAEGYIPTPEYLLKKHCIINVKNNDNQCFKWAVLSAMHPAVSHSDRVGNYKKYDGELNFDNINFPVEIGDIPKFENQNDSISINVFEPTGFPHYGVNPLYVSDHYYREFNIDLLLLGDNSNYHYVWIKNFSALISNYSKYKGKHLYCRRCISYVTTNQELLDRHIIDCKGVSESPQRVKLETDPKKKICFKNYPRKMEVPFVIYADFEANNVVVAPPGDEPGGESGETNTKILTKHKINSFCYIIKRYDGPTELVMYRAKSDSTDVAKVFLDTIIAERDRIVEEYFRHPKEMIITPEQQAAFDSATKCYVCEHYFTPDNSKCRDHCHITGTFRGAACNRCNLGMKITDSTPIPVVFHNLKGYDSHFIMQAIGKVEDSPENKIGCIAQNSEKYISFTLGTLRFIDSLGFLNKSLSELAKSLQPEDYKIFDKYLPSILRQKGYYPYDYVDSYTRFDETDLPPMESFYSRLTREEIKPENYDHAKKVWADCQCQNFGDYHDLYLKSDVLLLADIFENFRKTSIKHYGLDPAHYYTTPGLAWDAMLRFTKVNLDYITDIDIHLFIEAGMRGGVSMVSKRYAKANNKYCPGFDITKPATFLAYIDANNLYGWAMCQALPKDNFRWVPPTRFRNFQRILPKIKPDSKVGYFIECDLDYPAELHDLHNDYPLAVEVLSPKDEWLSPYQKDLLTTRKLIETDKLVPNLNPKERYVLHYRNLQLYLELGMHITKIHRILSFSQSAWMEPYIELNTKLRTQAKTDFEKDFFKLMNNSVFGKTMENVRKRTNIELVRSTNNQKITKLVSQPTYASMNDFGDGLVAVHRTKKVVVLDKPIYVGMTVLDLSKLLMYDFWYKNIKAKYQSKVQLCYTDTDSLLYEVQTDNIYVDMLEDSTLYDFSDFPKSQEEYPDGIPLCYNLTNKKVIGKFKDEAIGDAKFRMISEFVGLRPKMYSVKFTEKDAKGKNEKNKAKGISTTTVEHDIKMEKYKEALFTGEDQHNKNTTIRHHNHDLQLVEVKKISLSPLDTKRYILSDGITSYAYGHYRITS